MISTGDFINRPVDIKQLSYNMLKIALGIIGLHWALFAWIGGHVGSARVFGYQHIGIGNGKVSRFGYRPT